MPRGRFLKILVGELLALAILFMLSVEFSLTNFPPEINNYQAYQQAAKEGLEAAQASVVGAVEWFGELTAEELIALFTGILAVATIFLWISTQLILRDSRFTTERQLRAYISYKGGYFAEIDVPAFGTNKIPQCNIILVNQGQTPAKNVKINWRTWITAEHDFLLVAPFEEKTKGGTSKFLAPQAEIEISAMLSRKLEAAEFEHFKVGLLVYRAAFHVTYDDVFGGHHFYKFGRAANLSTVHGMIYIEQWDGHDNDEDSD